MRLLPVMMLHNLRPREDGQRANDFIPCTVPHALYITFGVTSGLSVDSASDGYLGSRALISFIFGSFFNWRPLCMMPKEAQIRLRGQYQDDIEESNKTEERLNGKCPRRCHAGRPMERHKSDNG